MPKKDYSVVGQRYGQWTVQRISNRKDKHGWRYWVFCLCDCGTSREVKICHLKSGRSRSCGCLKTGIHGGQSYVRGKEKEYRAWTSAKTRCTNPRYPKFRDYGGRGIAMCADWKYSFQKFYEDMGRCSTNYTLERKNNHRGYEPGNCIWATREVQTRNRKTTRWITFGGQRKVLVEWAEILGIHYMTLWGRLNAGWSVKKAFTTAVQKHHKITK